MTPCDPGVLDALGHWVSISDAIGSASDPNDPAGLPRKGQQTSRAPVRQALAPDAGGGPPGPPVSTLTTLNCSSTYTVTGVPSAFVMCAS